MYFIYIIIPSKAKPERSGDAKLKGLNEIASCLKIRQLDFLFKNPMKSGKKNNKTMKLFSATAVTLFSLATVFVATIAWFAMNKNTEGNGLNISVVQDEVSIQTVAIHRCILNQSTTTNLVFDSQNTTGTLVLPDYSELNKSQPTLLLFKLSGDQSSTADKIRITATSTNTSYVTEITEDNYDAFPFSSAICFKTIAVTSESFPFNSVSTSSLSEPVSFVEMAGSAFTGFNTTINVFDGAALENPPTDPLTYLGVILDYYDDALQYLSSCNTGNEYRLSFAFDFSMSVE